jgi:hypothetical protein
LSSDALKARLVASLFLERLFDGNFDLGSVHWDHFRLMQLIPGTAGAEPAQREQLLQRGFVELGRGKFDEQTERRSMESLRALVTQVIGKPYQFIDHDNPMLAALAIGPKDDATPNLRRLLLAVADIVAHASAVTIRGEADVLGERLMTLLFIGGKYVGFLPSRRAPETGAAKA